MFDELKHTAKVVLVLIALFYTIKFGYQIYEWWQFEQMPNVWDMKDGQLIQIKKDGQYIKQEGN